MRVMILFKHDLLSVTDWKLRNSNFLLNPLKSKNLSHKQISTHHDINNQFP